MLSTTGTSGGWGHLHFEVLVPMGNGTYRNEDAYALLVESYLAERNPPLLAVARPHLVAKPGEIVTLDGSRSIPGSQDIVGYRWRFHDGGQAKGAKAKRSYDRPGLYSEVLEVVGEDGAVAIDFAVVCVSGEKWPGYVSLNAAYAPVDGLKAGQEVSFQWANFPGAGQNKVSWDFGDGSKPKIHTARKPTSYDDAYPNTVTHRYSKPGEYIATVRWVEDDRISMYQLLVVVSD